MAKNKIRDLGPTAEKERIPSRESRNLNPILVNTQLTVSLALTLLLIVVHIARLMHAGALWRDEVVTINMAKMSFPEMWAVLNVESFPILVHLILKFLLMLGFNDTDLFLRIFGCIVGLSIIGTLWLNGRMLGYSFPVLSLILFGLNPWTVQYGDSIRAYGLGVLMNLLTFGVMWKVTQSTTPRWIITATIVAMASVHCLYQNGVFLLAISLGGCVVALLNRKPRTIVAILGIGAIAAATLIPYKGTIDSAREIAVVVNLPIGFDRIWTVMSDALGSPESFLRWIWAALFGTGIFVGGRSFIRRYSSGLSKEQRDRSVFCAVAMIVGTIGFLTFLKIASFITEPWYYLPLMAFVATSLEVLLFRTVRGTTIGIVATTVCVVVITGVVFLPVLKSTHMQFTNIDAIVDKLEEVADKEDLILVNPWYCGTTFQRYYGGSTLWMTIPPVEDYSVQRPDIIKKKMTMAEPLQPVFDAMKKRLESGKRVFFVGGLDFPSEGQEPPRLPPAPKGPHGWYSLDYIIAWSLQTGHYVRTHALRGEKVPLPPDADVSLYEKHDLLLVHGWQPGAR